MMVLTERLKLEFFKAVTMSVLLYGHTTWILLYTIPMNINGYILFLINMLDTVVRRIDMLIKRHPTSSGLPSSCLWWVSYFGIVVKISISILTSFLVISHSVTFCEVIIDFNKTAGDKARWEQDKDAACCFEQILEPVPYKTAVVWPLASHNTNHPSKMRKTC